jgi:hypothetical protein
LPQNASAALFVLTFPFSDAASLISSLESRLANSMPADAVELLKQKHAEELQGLQSQATKARELEVELTKAREAESKLRLEFDQPLAKEREILSAKYESEVDELCTSLDAKVKSRDAKIYELESLRMLDGEQHDKELSLWRARDRKLHSGLLGLQDALHGTLPSPFLSFRSFRPFPYFLVALAGAFPDSDKAAMAALEKYREEQKIVRDKDSKAELTSGELTALVKGRLHPVAELGAIFTKPLSLCLKLYGLGERCLTTSRRSSNGSRSCPTGSTSGRSLRPEPALRKPWSSCSRGTRELTRTN